MLQAKAVGSKRRRLVPRQDLTSTDTVGSIAGIPVVSGIVNAMNRNATFRGILQDGFGVHKDAKLPEYHSKPLRDRVSRDFRARVPRPLARPPARWSCSPPATATATTRRAAKTWSRCSATTGSR